MIWVLGNELLRDAFREAPKMQVAMVGVVGFSAMFTFQFLLLA